MSKPPIGLQAAQLAQPPLPPESRGMRVIRPFDKQIEAHETVLKNTITLYGGAIRGGKTYFMLLELFSLSQEYDNSRWLVMRADMPRFEQTTLRSFEEILDTGMGRYLARWHKGTNTVTWKNGSQFVFMAESYSNDKEQMRLHGFECNGAGLDEVNELQELTLGKIIERSGTWFHAKKNRYGQKCPIKIIMTCNPSNNWVKTRFYDKWKRDQAGLPGGLPRGNAYVPSRIYDNPYVGEEFMQSLRDNMEPEKYARFVDGDWDFVEKTGREWVSKFDFLTHTGDVPFVRDLRVNTSHDFNVLPYQTMLGIQVLQSKGITWVRVFDEFCGEPPFNAQEFNCKELKSNYLEPYGYVPVDIYGDASAKYGVDGYRDIFRELISYTHNNSFQVPGKNPWLSFARDLVNDILANKYPTIRVIIDRDNCKNLIRDLDTLQTGPEGFNPEIIKDAFGNRVETKGHCYSAFAYFICEYFHHLLKSSADIK